MSLQRRTHARSFVRTILALVTVLVAASCGELAQEPKLGPHAGLALAIAWPGEGTQASAVFGADVDAVRIGISRQSEETVLDTIIPWAANDPDFRLAFDVPLVQRVETLYVYLDLMAGQSTRFYSYQQIIVTEEGFPALPPFELTYIGPGYDAVFLTVTPRGTFVQPNGTAQFTATAQNGQGQNLTTPTAWSVSDARLATINASGLLTAKSGLGSVYVKAAIANGLKDSALVQIATQVP